MAVDVFGGVVDGRDLLAEALGGGGSLMKGKKKVKVDVDVDVDVGGKTGVKKGGVVGEVELEFGEAKKKFVGKKEGTVGEEIGGVGEVVEVGKDEMKGKVKEEVEEVEEVFDVDDEVVKEFDQFSKEVSDFTLAGRRKSAKQKRKVKADKVQGSLQNVKYANYGSGGEKYTSVRLEDVGVVFRDTQVLKSVSWEVKTGDRIGLVGPNGCGKTTQLKIIAGMLKPTTGEVVRSGKRTKVAFLKQEFVDDLDPKRTLREEFLTCFEEEYSLLREFDELETKINAAGEDLTKLETLLNRMEEVRIKCEERDAWNLDARIDKVVPGLGFVPDDHERLVASFSGGWKVRIGLGKVLLQDPDLLLLDEPTNHLDLESVEWLEGYLRGSSLPMIVVSHDREFMDRLCNKMIEVDGGEAYEYPGNYSRFLTLREERRKAWENAYEKQQDFLNEQRAFIKKYHQTAARVKQVKSREKMLERMESTGQLVRKPPHNGKPLVFRFPPAPRSGLDVVSIENVHHGYGAQTLLDGVDVVLERGDRIAILGPNGAGKSTLLRLITGIEKPDSGTVECASGHNVKLAYFEQNQADALDLTKTVLETVMGAAPTDMRYEQVRALLGKFLFKGDAVEKKVSSLSGGEKARLALVKIMLEPANVLVLDEPTNHLDITAKEMLEEALQHYNGTLIVVSHDRYFVSRVASQIMAIENQDLILYDGDYKHYIEKQKDIKMKLQERYIRGLTEIKSAPSFVFNESTEAGAPPSRRKTFGGSGVQSGRVKEANAKRWKY